MSEFEEWWNASKYMQVVFSNESTKRVVLDGWQAAKQSMQSESIPAGFALVPIKETKAIRLVVEQEDWEWRDVLAAAGSITEEEFNSPDYVETIADLQAENEALRKDAERYRWLRHGDNDELVIQHGPVAHDYHWLPRNERLDEQIDAAISKGGEL